MAVGFPATKGDIDSRAGSLAVSMRDNLYACAQFSIWLGQQTDAQLIAAGYVQGEVNTLRAAFTDFTSLYNLAHAQATQAAANDFFFNAKLLMGVV